MQGAYLGKGVGVGPHEHDANVGGRVDCQVWQLQPAVWRRLPLRASRSHAMFSSRKWLTVWLSTNAPVLHEECRFSGWNRQHPCVPGGRWR
jgi:hypothetical protein